MVRMSKEAKAISNAKIIDEAARLFRQNGFAGTGVADIMSAAGLTHGGFYRHFKSKEELAGVAIAKAMDGIIDRLEAEQEKDGRKEALLSYTERYLSEKHVDHPELGCPIAALGAEANRGTQSYQKELEEGYNRLVQLFMKGIGGKPDAARMIAQDILTTLVGTVVVARTLHNQTQRQELLKVCRRKIKVSLMED